MRLPKWPRWVWRCYTGTFAAVAAFVVCSFWPMWIVARYEASGWCGVKYGDRHSLWGMLTSERPRDDSTGTCISVLTWEWETPAVFTAVSVHIAAVAGAVIGGVRWKKGR